MVFCPNCGSEIDSDAKFCNLCGAHLGDIAIKEEGVSPIPEESIPAKAAPTTIQEAKYQAEVKQVPVAKYASFGSRFVAWLIDIIIILVIWFIIWLFHPRMFWLFHNIILILMSLLYFWALEAFNKGQTIGKKALRLRAVNEETLQITTPGNYFVNNLFKCYPVLFLIDFIIGILANSGDPQKKLRIMQNMSKTVVIKEG